MKEYKVVKCRTCGQETKGPVLVRFTSIYRQIWEETIRDEWIFKAQYDRRVVLNALIAFPTIIFSLVNTAPMVSSIPPPTFTALIMELLKVCVVFMAPVAFVFGIIEWLIVQPVFRKYNQALAYKKEVLQGHGVEGGEPYEIVE